jgi:hypothetical protein
MTGKTGEKGDSGETKVIVNPAPEQSAGIALQQYKRGTLD